MKSIFSDFRSLKSISRFFSYFPEFGPNTFIRKDNEKVILAPTKMIIVPPRHFCIIRNPVKKDEDGEPMKDTLNQVHSVEKLEILSQKKIFSVKSIL